MHKLKYVYNFMLGLSFVTIAFMCKVFRLHNTKDKLLVKIKDQIDKL